MKGDMKKSVQLLEAQVRRDQKSEELYANLNSKIEETNRILRLDLQNSESKSIKLLAEMVELNSGGAKLPGEKQTGSLNKTENTTNLPKKHKNENIKTPTPSKMICRSRTWKEL